MAIFKNSMKPSQGIGLRRHTRSIRVKQDVVLILRSLESYTKKEGSANNEIYGEHLVRFEKYWHEKLLRDRY